MSVANRASRSIRAPSTRSPTVISTWSSRAAPLFEKVIVGVAASPSKGPRCRWSCAWTGARSAGGHPNVEVRGFDSLLAHFVQRVGGRRAAARPARGVRLRVRIPDGEHEPPPDPGGGDPVPDPAEQYGFISSSLVREIARLGGDVSGFVPAGGAAALARRNGREIGGPEPPTATTIPTRGNP
jgi:pantetheine-phosphate adenylyltransferase